LSIAGNCRKAKGAELEPFVPNCKTVAIPVQDFHEGMSSVEKDEQMVCQRIGFEDIANDTEQPVE